jgi:hypothetical protein
MSTDNQVQQLYLDIPVTCIIKHAGENKYVKCRLTILEPYNGEHYSLTIMDQELHGQTIEEYKNLFLIGHKYGLACGYSFANLLRSNMLSPDAFREQNRNKLHNHLGYYFKKVKEEQEGNKIISKYEEITEENFSESPIPDYEMKYYDLFNKNPKFLIRATNPEIYNYYKSIDIDLTTNQEFLYSVIHDNFLMGELDDGLWNSVYVEANYIKIERLILGRIIYHDFKRDNFPRIKHKYLVNLYDAIYNLDSANDYNKYYLRLVNYYAESDILDESPVNSCYYDTKIGLIPYFIAKNTSNKILLQLINHYVTNNTYLKQITTNRTHI